MRNALNAKQHSNAVAFGPFRLFLAERRLEKEGAPVHLGSRALDILLALAQRMNQLVSKDDLMAEVWPNIAVEDVSIR
jgi:DNA-binding winged helix-turn-helix (wHTH) protein